MSAGEAGRHVVEFEDLNIDVFLEVQSKKYSSILYLVNYIAYGLHGIKYKLSRTSAENLFPYILA